MFTPEVVQHGGAVRELEGRRVRERGARLHTVLQRRRRRYQLERRARREQLLGRPRQEWLAPSPEQRAAGLPDLARVVRGKGVGVVGGVVHHRQDLAGSRIQGHHPSGQGSERPSRQPLELRVDGGHHRGAPLGSAEDLVDEVLRDQLGCPPCQVVVLCGFQAVAAEHDRVIAGDAGVQGAVRVDPQVLELALRGAAPGQHRLSVPSQDVAAVHRVLLEQESLIRRVVCVAARGEDLQIVRLSEQHDEQGQESQGQPADLPVHHAGSPRGVCTVG